VGTLAGYLGRHEQCGGLTVAGVSGVLVVAAAILMAVGDGVDGKVAPVLLIVASAGVLASSLGSAIRRGRLFAGLDLRGER
jgi:hypothetical protein